VLTLAAGGAARIAVLLREQGVEPDESVPERMPATPRSR